MSSNRDSENWDTSSYCGDDQDIDIHSGGENEFPYDDSETNWGHTHDNHDDDDELVHEHDGFHYHDSEDEDHSEEEPHNDEDIDGIINGFAEANDSDEEEEHEHFGPGMTSHDFLSTLRQHMRHNETRGDGHEVRDENGRMNLSEVLPELLSMMGSAGGSGLRNRSDASSRSARINKLVDNVESAETDPYFAMESIIELSENLLMVNQIILERVFPMERMLNALVNILGSSTLKDEMELQMQCCRCLYNIFEVHPESISHAVDKDVIQFLQNKLTEINYIDLAEQVLETLELLSRLCGRDVLHNGNLSSYIQYFDFFTIHAQRKSIAIVSNACARVKKSDFNIIEELFITLKPIFLNCTDQVIVTRILGILYGVCGGLKDSEMLESLYTSDVTEHLVELISTTDTASDCRLKCLDILAFVVDYSPKISASIVKSTELASVLKKCLYQYSKNPNATLHETIMFVPKSLLNSISRFITLLFPPEEEQILTIENVNYKAKNQLFLEDFKNDGKISELLTKLIPLMSEIFINTVDFGTRRNVLIGLTRIATYMNEQVAIHSLEDLVRLLGSSLAQSKNVLKNESSSPYEVGILIIGLISLIRILERKYSSVFTSPFKREGIYDLMEHINQDALSLQGKGTFNASIVPTSGDTNDWEADSDNMQEDSEDDEEDYHTDYLDDMDIPKELLPKKLKFKFLKKLKGEEILDTIVESTELILSVVDSAGDIGSEELEAIKVTVKDLENMKVNLYSSEETLHFFSAVKDCIFKEQSVLSGFELISSELPTVIAKKLSGIDHTSCFYLEKTLKAAFGGKLVEFITILQSALTRVESFPIIDSGLQGESSGMESLGKQIKIHLHFDGEDKTFTPLSTVVVSIHCIASFKVLETFIRDRAAKARLFSWMIPGAEDNSEENDKAKTSGDVKAIKNSVLKFSYEGEPIDSHDTIFGALFKILKAKEGKTAKDMWNETQTVHFTKEDPVSVGETDSKEEINTEDDDEEMMDVDSNEEEEEETLTYLYSEKGAVADQSNGPAEDILKVLKVLRTVVSNEEYFINSKLSAKLTRQLDEPLVVAGGVLPEWTLSLTKEYSFLFPFETRMFFLQCTSFGYGRFIQLWKNRLSIENQLSSDDPLLQLGRISRSKILIARDNMLLAALRIMDDYSKSATILEFQFLDEEGTGLGPTLEFYSTVSKEFAQKKLNLWRVANFDEENSYVTGLLFPQPIVCCSKEKEKEKVVELFGYLGTFIARSLLDNRIVDFRFNKFFFQLAHLYARGETTLQYDNLDEGLNMLKAVDEQLAVSLKYIYDNRNNQPVIDEMSLTFVLPGTNIELIDNGAKLNVHGDNVADYIRHIISSIIGEDVKDSIQSFITGFSKVFPYSNLLILTPEELVDLFGGVEENWSTETLYSCIEANHGYTMDSMSIHNLISIMSEFNLQERRTFLQFITGSPKLPLGGFKSLKPKLTVVLKQPEAGFTSDEYLASVMTCANYLKLPKYSSKEVMRQRIVQAMNEGAGAFLLS